MSVLIKGKKIPNNCLECFCLNDEYLYCQAVGRKPSDDNLVKTRPNWCPLIEIQPHGDLIDRDEQIERAWRLNLSTRELIEEMLKSAQTIVPAEESET